MVTLDLSYVVSYFEASSEIQGDRKDLLENLVHTIYSIIFLLVDDFRVDLRCGYILVP